MNEILMFHVLTCCLVPRPILNYTKSEMPKEKKTGKHKSKVIHPNSRKAAQLVREVHRKERLDRRKAEKDITVSNQIVKLMWFRDHIDEEKKFYTHSEMLDLVERYIHRLDDELERLLDLQSDKPHTAGHYRLQHAGREDAIRGIMVTERELFEGQGIEAPDLTSLKTFKIFLEWRGEEKMLPKIQLKKYRTKPSTCISGTDVPVPE